MAQKGVRYGVQASVVVFARCRHVVGQVIYFIKERCRSSASKKSGYCGKKNTCKSFYVCVRVARVAYGNQTHSSHRVLSSLHTTAVGFWSECSSAQVCVCFAKNRALRFLGQYSGPHMSASNLPRKSWSVPGFGSYSGSRSSFVHCQHNVVAVVSFAQFSVCTIFLSLLMSRTCCNPSTFLCFLVCRVFFLCFALVCVHLFIAFSQSLDGE